MRTRTLLLAAACSAALCAAGPGPAAAKKRTRRTSGNAHVAGKYAVTFEEVSNNCGSIGIGMNLGTASVQISESHGGRAIQVTIPAVPIMSGTATKGGKFRAVAKRGKTAIQGVDGRFSVAGRVDKKGLQVLFIAEYYRGKKPLCTQSWNAHGPRR